MNALGTLEWFALAAIVCPWAITAAVILSVRSFGRYAGGRARDLAEIQGQRSALQQSHERETAALRGNVEALKEVIRLRQENHDLRQREVA